MTSSPTRIGARATTAARSTRTAIPVCRSGPVSAAADRGRSIDLAINITAPDDVLVERMLGRAKDSGRSDDTPDAIRTRLEVQKPPAELLDHYRSAGKLRDVDGQPGIEEVTAAVVRALGIPDQFPEEVLDEARDQARRFSEEDLGGREDFTKQLVITIDPADAKDFDDGVSLMRDPDTGHWVLTVHIADVAHFVQPGGPLDREALYWHYPHYSNQGGFPGGAVRMGDWKLLERFEDGRVHLYNLKEDLGEKTDLADKHPGRVAELRKKLHAWYKDVGAQFLRPRPGGPMPWRPGKDD